MEDVSKQNENELDQFYTNKDISHRFMISTHLNTFEPQKGDFAKHAQPQLKKLRA